ncbi:MAG: long-chain fatty acid--CoA ligase [candidate division KSB1 bacterium]|nr:long-chain fatty acid--CoA ligase [candidate division KSB1 bacterium]MDZ7275674.1 long-chain fatty acid--CoA ligase [candidate division KSB1 bacterium]MDZ7284635.1 long-chain fatty acid--CoA ligase [candidate division KSB1 bacterium]MDZ7297946.1 long-chain fatty acid--CoA ligase [candidate division KSB1 bacterium]MDZ7308325.1 long-chain fatty acid--CoA ligase [candidate division KSB1 bacterium]
MPIQPSTYVTDWLHKRACLTPEQPALLDRASGRQLTFAEWNAQANRTANFLRALGVQPGDRVSVYASNCPAYLDLLFACGKIGAILHNLNWRLTVFELRVLLAEAEAKVLCYSPEWRLQVEELRPALGNTTIVALGEPAAGERGFHEREQYADILPDPAQLHSDDAWAIFYTGGTTGLPKGAVLTHGNMTWNSINTVTSWGLTAADCAALQLPLFHIGGPNIFMLPLVHVGGRTILCRGFEVDETFDLVESGAITLYVGVPTMFIMLQQHPRWQQADFSRLKLVISGGASCPLPVMQKFWDKGVDFKTGYGLTEAAGNNFWLPPPQVRRKPGAVGFPLFHIDMKIVRPDGSRCAAQEAGELLIRGPHVMAGYWRKPEETAAVLRDGWLHTGDLARQDEEGCFYIIGRSKDMFISGGENVYPAEVESALHAHPAVAEAAVIGVPDETWGEVGKAFLVLKAGRQVSEQELLAFLRTRLAKYKIPRSFEFLAALPKTAIGKIDKKKLQPGP